MRTSELRLSNLSFAWASHMTYLFSPIDAEFEQGTITTILGLNGVGKTTLLNLIARRISPSTGEILVQNRPAVFSDFNYMLQDSSRLLFPHLTLGQNLALKKHTGDALTAGVLNLTSLLFPDPSILSQYPGNCSGGQRQRAVLCRTINDMPSFPVTLLDEPFSQISQDVKADLYSALRVVARQHDRAVILVTHDLPEAVIVGDMVAILSLAGLHRFDASGITDISSFARASRLRDQVQECLFSVCSDALSPIEGSS